VNVEADSTLLVGRYWLLGNAKAVFFSLKESFAPLHDSGGAWWFTTLVGICLVS